MMSDSGYGELEDTAGGAVEAEEAPPQLVFGSVDEFVREQLTYTYLRVVGPRGQRRWSAEWWRSAEATSRLESLWRAWEHLRQDGTTGMSSWWRDHLDHHMPVLMSADGPFADSTDSNNPGEPLPYTRPPTGMFPDVRPGHPTEISLLASSQSDGAPAAQPQSEDQP